MQVLEDERIEGTLIGYGTFRPEKHVCDNWAFLVDCVVKGLVWSFLEETDREGQLKEMNM